MRYSCTFSILGLVCAFYAATLEPLWLRVLFGSLALCWIGVGAAYSGVGGRVFGKRRDGRLSLWSLMFWPFHLLNFALLSACRGNKRENPFDEIEPGVLLGCQLNARDEAELAQHNVRAVLDLTCEFSEAPFLRALNYRSLPVLDTRAPTLEQLQEGVDFIATSSQNGAVYVHCALFVAAHLLRSGRAQSVNEALELIRAKRANIELHPAQRELLRHFEVGT